MAAAVAVGMLVSAYAFAASNQPMDLTADEIEYDSVSGVATATGSVRMTQEDSIVTGSKAVYNTKNKEAEITGGVEMVKGDMRLNAARVVSKDNQHVLALGGVMVVKGDTTLIGPQAEYFAGREYVLVPSDAKVTMPDGVMTTDRLEYFMKEERAVGTGNVHVISDARKLDARGDLVTYYGAEGQQGKVVLSGNAVAVQDNNTLRGKTLTMYLEEKPPADGQRTVQVE